MLTRRESSDSSRWTEVHLSDFDYCAPTALGVHFFRHSGQNARENFRSEWSLTYRSSCCQPSSSSWIFLHPAHIGSIPRKISKSSCTLVSKIARIAVDHVATSARPRSAM